MKYVHVVDGVVTELFDVQDGFNYQPPDSEHYFEVSNVQNIAVGWLRNADGTYSTPPAPLPPSLDQRRTVVIALIDAEMNTRLNGGFQFQGDWFASDIKTQLNMTGEVIAEQIDPTTVLYMYTIDGNKRIFNAQSFAALGMALKAYDDGVYAAAEQHEANVKQCDDPEAYDFSTGWPQCYADFLAIQNGSK